MEHVEIPEKLFYRINEVSSITQIKPYVLRYWETEFPMLGPEKDENDQRRYRRGDIELILEIKRLLYTEKFTIAGARKQLRSQPQAPPAEVAAPSRMEAPVQVNLQRYRRLNEGLSHLRHDVEDLCRMLA
ncbi:MAG: MerR family transcriptional regulator [Candidatus Sumerlaeaceae bacterium]